MGVKKLFEAPKQTEKINGLGSIPEWLLIAIAMGVNTIATAALDKNDEIIIESKYKDDIIII